MLVKLAVCKRLSIIMAVELPLPIQQSVTNTVNTFLSIVRSFTQQPTYSVKTLKSSIFMNLEKGGNNEVCHNLETVRSAVQVNK